jgi:dolichol-phosphate mannosyltransferase
LYYYNIHDIIKVQSDVILYELEYFKSREFENPELSIRTLDSLAGGLRFSRKIMEDRSTNSHKILYTEHLGSAGAQFSIEFGQRIEVTINKLISKSKHVLYVNIVEPLLRFIFISRGFILLHSACLDKSESGLLLSAPPDTGKTTTVLKCVKNGFSFLSDDMTIIKLPNQALCFPKPMTISSHTFKTAVSVSNTRDTDRSMRVRSLVHSKKGRAFMHKIAKLNVPIFTINTIGQSIVRPPKYSINSILQDAKIKKDTKIDTLYFLEREGNYFIPLDTTSALDLAVENSDDAFIFPPYAELLNHIAINGRTAFELLEEEKKLLRTFLSGIRCFVLKSESRAWFNLISKFTENKAVD